MSYKESVTPQEVVDFLNELIKLSPQAINELFETRVLCSKNLADHPTVQVTPTHFVGILGILNGLFGVNENNRGCIAGVFNESGTLTHFEILP